MELMDTASDYIKSVTANTCVRSAINNADVIILHDNDVQVNLSAVVVLHALCACVTHITCSQWLKCKK